MTIDEQVEAQITMSETRYRLLKKLDQRIEQLIDLEAEDKPLSETISRLAGLRIALFRELMEVALTGVSAKSLSAYSESDYRKWLDLVDKGVQKEDE